MERAQLAAMVDHTLLKAEASSTEIDQLCAEADQWRCATVCVNPVWVRHAALRLADSEVGVCVVVGFPLGANCSIIKAQEAALAVSQGANEIDMVINLSRLFSGQYSAVRDDISRVREACPHASLKVTVESALLHQRGLARACGLALEGGADWVKTSTGVNAAGGASVEAVKLMTTSVGNKAQVKASGGIRNLATAAAMIDAGATRLGLSATETILGELEL